MDAKPLVRHNATTKEFFFQDEKIYVKELLNPKTSGINYVSIAKIRVQPGVTTSLHKLTVNECYLILEGKGRVRVGDTISEIGPEDAVVIPAGVAQQITNIGESQLIFICVTNPGWTENCYSTVKENVGQQKPETLL